MTMFKIMFYAEGMHPLEGGGLRLKYRRDRRPGLPIDRVGIFHLKLSRRRDPLAQAQDLRPARLAGLAHTSARKVRNDPNRYAYTDLAIAPVAEEELDTLALFAETSGGEGAVRKKRGEDVARAKVAAARIAAE